MRGQRRRELFGTNAKPAPAGRSICIRIEGL